MIASKVKRKMDYEGLVVRSKKPLGNRIGELPPDTLFIVESWTGGLYLKSKPCECCELSLTISKVSLNDVEFLQSSYNIERLKWNQERHYKKGYRGRVLINPTKEKPTISL